MNSPRVNLLKKSEQRYQGAVSHRFLLVSLVITPILLIAVLSSIKLVQYTGVQSQLKSSRMLWAELEPKLDLFRDENKGLDANRKMLDLIHEWNESQGSFVQLLDDIQDTVPNNVQFKRLSIRGELASVSYAVPEDVGMDYTLVIEGHSEGASAENDVISLRRDLLACKQISSTFDSLKLASMRKRDSDKGINVREFRIEGANDDGGEE